MELAVARTRGIKGMSLARPTRPVKTPIQQPLIGDAFPKQDQNKQPRRSTLSNLANKLSGDNSECIL